MDVFYITVKRRIIDCPMWKASRNKKLASLFSTSAMCKEKFKGNETANDIAECDYGQEISNSQGNNGLCERSV